MVLGGGAGTRHCRCMLGAVPSPDRGTGLPSLTGWLGSPASARWRAPPPTPCSRSTTPATARWPSGSAPAPCSTSGAASATRPSRLAGLGRLVIGVDYDPQTAVDAAHEWEPAGLRFAAMDGGRIGARAGSIDWVCSSHIIEHFRRARAARRRARPRRHRRRHRPRHHAEPPRRLREPVPRVAVRGGRAGVAARRCSSHDVTVHGLEGSPELHADFAQRRASGERILKLDPLDLRHKVPVRLVRVELRARAAGRLQGCSAPGAPASARVSTSRTSSSPTRSRRPPPGCSQWRAARAADGYFAQRPRESGRSPLVGGIGIARPRPPP